MSLGGRITLALALLWAGCLLAPISGIVHGSSPGILINFLWLAYIILAFPFALLGTGVMNAHGANTAESIRYFAFMLPNLFFLGYATAAIWRLVLRMIRPLSRDFT